MDEKEKAKWLEEARALAKKAKQIPKSEQRELTVLSGETSSLGKVINTKEKADIFMKLLRSF